MIVLAKVIEELSRLQIDVRFQIWLKLENRTWFGVGKGSLFSAVNAN